MKVLGIIPARLDSERLPRKLLRRDTGKPLLQSTWENAQESTLIDRLVIATDSELIREAVEKFGGECVLTAQRASGTDRVAEAAEQFGAFDIVVNIQGDEPEIPPSDLDHLIATLKSNIQSQMATLATPIEDPETIDNPNCVKVVLDQNNNAIYFSRYPIPYRRHADTDTRFYQHIGVYAFRRDFLIQYASWPETPAEKAEGLEQLRALENGHAIKVCIIEHHWPGIDTLKDYLDFVERQTGSN